MTEKKNEKSQPTEGAQPDANALTLPSGSGLASGIFDDLFRPFDEFMQPFFPSTRSFFPELTSFRQPTMDIQDRGDHFNLTAELPGFTKDDVEVKVGANGIELKAERSEKQGKETNGAYLTRSRSYFHQYLSLPEHANVEKVDGTMKNGILELRIPKKAQKREDKTRRVDLK